MPNFPIKEREDRPRIYKDVFSKDAQDVIYIVGMKHRS